MSGGSRVNKWLWSEQEKKVLRHSNGEAVHFGGDVVALEKDEMFKRVYVHGEYSMYFFPPTAFFSTKCFWGMQVCCRVRRGIISVSVSLRAWRCANMYIWMSMARLWLLIKCVRKCVCLHVCFSICFARTHTHSAEGVFVYNLLAAGGSCPSWPWLEMSTKQCVCLTVYISLCMCVVCACVYALGQCQHTGLLPSSLANYTRALKAT